MRIVHVIDSGGLYGAERVLLHLMREQARAGVLPLLASIGTPGEPAKPVEDEARALGLTVEPIRMRPGIDPAGVRRILAWSKQNHGSLFHSHGYKGNILLGLLPKKVRGLPMVATVHGYTGGSGLNRMALYDRLDVVALRRIDRAILVDPAMQDHPLLRGKRAWDVVENGIATPLEPADLPPDLAAFASSGRCIACVGRLSEEKGIERLLDAVAALRGEGQELRLALIGEGPLRAALEGRARELGIGERVFFAGYVADAGRTLGHFDLFVMPSLTEGLPMVLLEAMAVGTRVVATRVGGIPRVLDGGQCGILVEPGDATALARGITEAFANPAAAAERARAGQARVETHFSSAAMARAYETIYRELLPAGPVR